MIMTNTGRDVQSIADCRRGTGEQGDGGLGVALWIEFKSHASASLN